MWIYDTQDYKTILRDALLEKKKIFGARFTFSRLADACRVQKTYLSKVLNGDGHLSADQLFLACDYLGFNRDERHYIFTLYERAKSDLPNRRAELSATISDLQRKFRKTREYIAAPAHSPPANDYADYYLDPSLQIVHMFLTIGEYARDSNRIAREVGISETRLIEIINRLQALGLITLRDGQYIVTTRSLHLDDSSPLYPPYRILMRAKALDQIQKVPKEKAYCFSVVFSSNLHVRNAIQARFLKFLKSVEALTVEFPAEEEVFQMNFDLFPWSR